MKKILITIPSEINDTLDLAKEYLNISKSKMIREALTYYWMNQNPDIWKVYRQLLLVEATNRIRVKNLTPESEGLEED